MKLHRLLQLYVGIKVSWYSIQTYRTHGLAPISYIIKSDRFRDEVLVPSVDEYLRLRELSRCNATSDVDIVAPDVQGLGPAEREIFDTFLNQQFSFYLGVEGKSVVHEVEEYIIFRICVLRCLQVGCVSALWMLGTAKLRRKGRTSPSLFSKGMLPGYSLLPIIRHIFLAVRGVHSLQADQNQWQPLYGVYFPCSLAALLLGSIWLYGFSVSVLHAAGWLIRYEATIFLIAWAGDAAMALLLGNSTKRMPNLRNKPRYAVLLLLQIAIEYWIPMLSPLTLTASLNVYLWSDPKNEYLTKVPVSVSASRSRVFCLTCSNTIFATFYEDKFVRRYQFAMYDKPVKSSRTMHHWSEISLRQAATEGCRICTAAWEQRLRTPKDLWGTLRFWRPVTSFAMDDSTAVVYQEGNRDLGKYCCSFDIDDSRIEVQADHRTNRGPFNCVTDKCITAHTASRPGLELAQSWLQGCVSSHSCAGMSRREDFTPRRLVFLGAPPKHPPASFDDLDFSDLCLQTRVPARKSYMTLSHCWGGISTIQLLSTNEQELHHHIDFDSLPPTFKDAMRLAKWLGSEYLWIDSLCIVQDRPQDSHEEIASMGQIYRYSLCNIAASDGSNSRAGCFFKRNPYALQPEVIQIRGKNHVFLNCTDLYRSDHVLYTRAWVLQEAYLAPRTIDCGRGQLFWRCSRQTASEIFPHGVTESVLQLTHPAASLNTIVTKSTGGALVAMNMTSLEQSLVDSQRLVENEISVINVLPTQGRCGEALTLWSVIVQTFTAMELTFPDDRLKALEGIIRMLSPYLGMSCAGMWECFFPFELLWKVDSLSDRKRPLRAPSWSWQSLDCFISYQGCYFDPDIDKLVTRFVKIQPNSKHNERPTSITLRGPLFSACWRSNDDPNPHKKVYQPIRLEIVDGKQRTIKIGDFSLPFLTGEWGYIYLDELVTDLRPRSKWTLWKDDSPIKGIFCLPIFKQNRCLTQGTRADTAFFRKPYYKGLILKLKTRQEGPSEPLTYARIGYFEDDAACLEPFINGRAAEEVVIV